MRPRLPPNGMFIPTNFIFDQTLPDPVKVTYWQLRALGWGQTETVPFSAAEFEKDTGKSRATLYGHLKLLRTRDACSWRTLSDQTMVVSFNLASADQPPEAPEPAVPSRILDAAAQSRILDLPNQSFPDQKLLQSAETASARPESKILDGSPDHDAPPATPAATTPKPRALSERQLVIQRLERYFSSKTNLALPARNTEREKRAASTRWWIPLDNIWKLAGGVEPAEQLITQAIIKMRRDQLTISAPQSIEQVCIALQAEAQHGQPGNNQSVGQPAQRAYTDQQRAVAAQINARRSAPGARTTSA